VGDSGSAGPWRSSSDPSRPLRIAVIALPSLSNFTDFDALRGEPSVSIHFCRNREGLVHADVIILPGSKQTADDLEWMRSAGLDSELTAYAQTGLIVGICGGMQMLGTSISDPHSVERAGSIAGLGLLAIETVMQPQKATKISSGHLVSSFIFGQPVPPLTLSGYEIHIGEARYLEGAKPFAKLRAASSGGNQEFLDGCSVTDGRVFGSYLHGIFDDDNFRQTFLSAARAFRKLDSLVVVNQWRQKRDESLNRLADTVRRSLDMPSVFAWAGLRSETRGCDGPRL
jgi:adenosylcobyric acid synthase